MQIARAMLAAGFFAASPAAVAAPCAGFDDVSDSDPFCVYVDWMKNRGITLGLTPTQYDPAGYVTRMQMAAFMYRLGFQNAFLQGGNAFGATAVLGTEDDHALELRAGNRRVMRFEPNAISPNLIGGSPANSVAAGVRGATIAGGGVPTGSTDPDFNSEAPNRVLSHYGSVGGGWGNVVGADAGSLASAAFSTIAGGFNNTAGGTVNAIGGGINNVADGQGSAIGGGSGNAAVGLYGVIAGGFENTITVGGSGGTISGGSGNVVSAGGGTVPGGSDNVASGDNSFAAGADSEARGAYSVALGRRAKTFLGGNPGLGAIVIADANDFDFAEPFDNRLAIRATGGMRFVTQIDASGDATRTMSLGANGNLTVQGTVTESSDRAAKVAIEPIDALQWLDGVLSLPIATWSYRGDPLVRHVGPMAQDFHRQFAVGADERGIAGLDGNGVALAAIQGLNAKLEAQLAERDARLSMRDAEVAALRAEVAALRTLQEDLASVRAPLIDRATLVAK